MPNRNEKNSTAQTNYIADSLGCPDTSSESAGAGCSDSSATEPSETQDEIRPDYIAERHWNEWKASGASGDIIRRNVRTIGDPREVDELLNRNGDRRWKHSDDLAPGWAVSGINPSTGERTLLGAQLKPDTPRQQLGKDGKPNGKYRKYESVLGYEATPLYLESKNIDWQRVRDNSSQRVFVGEGGKTVGALISNGFPAISLPGVANGQKLGRLHDSLEPFCGVGRTVYTCFDNDLTTNSNVQAALDTLGRLIRAEGAVVRVVQIPPRDGEKEGADDYIVRCGADAFRTLVDEALTFEEWRKDSGIKKDIEAKVARQDRLTIEELKEEVAKLLIADLSESGLTAAFLELETKSGKSAHSIRKLYEDLQRDHERKEQPTSVPELLALSQAKLDPFDYLPRNLALLLCKAATDMPTSQSWLLTILWAALGASIGSSSRVIVSRKSQYVLPPIIQSVIVAKSGKLKTPTQNIILKPLERMEQEAFKLWEMQDKTYQKELAAWQKGKNAPAPDEPPPRERFLTNNATVEGLCAVQAQGGARGLMLHVDELKGFYQSFNKYSAGKGDDHEFWLPSFNGGGFVKDRAGKGASLAIESMHTCIAGSIQWTELQKIMGNCQDGSGMFARFIYCADDAPDAYKNFVDDDDADLALTSALESLYRGLRALPRQDYLLSLEARELAQPWQHSLIDSTKAESHEGLANVYSKIETYTFRLALIIHLTNAVLDGKKPEPVISGATIQQAIKLAAYYLGQAKLVYGTLDPASKDDGKLLQLVRLVKSKGEVDARAAKMGVKAFRNTDSTQIRQYFVQAAAKGLGIVSADGKKFSCFVDPILPMLTSVDESVDPLKPLPRKESSDLLTLLTSSIKKGAEGDQKIKVGRGNEKSGSTRSTNKKEDDESIDIYTFQPPTTGSTKRSTSGQQNQERSTKSSTHEKQATNAESWRTVCEFTPTDEQVARWIHENEPPPPNRIEQEGFRKGEMVTLEGFPVRNPVRVCRFLLDPVAWSQSKKRHVLVAVKDGDIEHQVSISLLQRHIREAS